MYMALEIDHSHSRVSRPHVTENDVFVDPSRLVCVTKRKVENVGPILNLVLVNPTFFEPRHCRYMCVTTRGAR